VLYVFCLPHILTCLRSWCNPTQRYIGTQRYVDTQLYPYKSSQSPEVFHIQSSLSGSFGSVSRDEQCYTGSNVTSGFLTEASLLSEVEADVAQCSSESTRNVVLSVVYMHMKFVDLRLKSLHKFMQINLEDFQRFLLSLPVCYKSEQRNPFFDTAILSSYMTFPDLFDYLDHYWDYINYDLLECVIRQFGDDELKEEMNSYCTQFAEVQSVTTLQQLIVLAHSHPVLQIARPHDVFIELVVELDANWDKYSMLDAERLRQNFISTYSLAPYSIAFCTAHEGTIVLKLWLRSECAPVIFHCKSQPVIDSRNSKLLQITVDGILYQFHSFQIASVEVCQLSFMFWCFANSIE